MITLHQVKRLGLEIWIIRVGGREVHSFLSERLARTRFEIIRQQIGRANVILPHTTSMSGL